MVSGSEFLAFGARADTPEEALGVLADVRARHPGATHHCWAYKIGAAYRFSDDGEPGGTAGAPILRAIEGRGLDRVVVVVARYFGGVKLGTGGLARAYGGAAAELLRTAPREEVKPRVTLLVEVGFEWLDTLHRLLLSPEFDLRRGEETYGEAGLSLAVAVLAEQREAFEIRLRDVTRGAARISPVD